MRNLSIALTALALVACGAADVKETPLNSVNFDDPGEIQAIALDLEPADRAGFQQYVAGRMVGATFGGVGLTRPTGELPATVGEAVALGKAARAKLDESNRLWEERNALVDRRNALLDENYQLTEADRAEWERLGKAVAEYDSRIAALN
jgi:hypothetical protein